MLSCRYTPKFPTYMLCSASSSQTFLTLCPALSLSKIHSRTHNPMFAEEGREPMADMSYAERQVINASYHLLKALQTTKSLSNDTKKLLGDLDIHLSTIVRLNEDEAEDYREIETRLTSAHRTIVSFHSAHSNIWASNPLEYLQTVTEVQTLISSLENMPLKSSSRTKELSDQAHSILHMAMERLQHELLYILIQNKQILNSENGSLPKYQESPVFDESFFLNEDDSNDSIENALPRPPGDGRMMEIEEYVVDLIHPEAIPHIKSIADIMLTSGYIQEFCQSFTGFWRDALVEYLTVIDVEHLSVEDVLDVEWKSLNSRIRKWRVAVKSIIGVYLASAKSLFDKVLGEYSSICLIEASKGPVLFLLNFGQAVAVGPHRPEWLFCLLDMYEVLAGLEQDVDALFQHEMGSLVRTEFQELLTRLGDSANTIFKELGHYIESCSSTTPYANGGIHPLTKYVVNYILCFAEYGPTLDFLLQGQDMEENGGPNPNGEVATHLQSLTSILDANLEKRSSLYKDGPLKHIFMMNNTHYMVEKIRNSKLSPYFGDGWIRNHMVKSRQHAIRYERATWSSLLTLLRNEGKTGKAALKARSRTFVTGFEELYKNQTGWLVPNLQLREEIRISASKIVIQAYRSFVSKIMNSIGEKYIKYSEQELGTYIMDLLEGSPKSLNQSRKR